MGLGFMPKNDKYYRYTLSVDIVELKKMFEEEQI